MRSLSLRLTLAACAAGLFGAAASAQQPDGPSVLSPPPGGRAMSADEVDRVIDRILGNGTRIERLQANLTNIVYTSATPDGPARDRKVTHGFLRLSVPNLMFIQDYGEDADGRPRTKAPRGAEDSGYMIVDGQWFYNIDASAGRNQPARGTRDRLAANVIGGDMRNITAVLGMFLGLERPVVNAAEMRRDFDVQGVFGAYEGVAQHHLRLSPHGNAGYAVDLWHRPEASLPWRVKILERELVFNPVAAVQEQHIFRHTERRLADLKTNLDGLRPFPRGAFDVPRMKVDFGDNRR